VIWGDAEIAMTIVAASIPVLRVLLKDVKSSSGRGGYRYGYDANGGDNDYAYGSKGGTVLRSRISISGGLAPRNFMDPIPKGGAVFTSQRKFGSLPSREKIESDDGSDKSILNMPVAPGRIMQTQEINVEYHHRSFPVSRTTPVLDGVDDYELETIR
jgi:hypothetical protein